jgi:hypothetical protein
MAIKQVKSICVIVTAMFKVMQPPLMGIELGKQKKRGDYGQRPRETWGWQKHKRTTANSHVRRGAAHNTRELQPPTTLDVRRQTLRHTPDLGTLTNLGKSPTHFMSA